MEYKIQKKDLEKCFKFAVEYRLDKTKSATNRTTGQYRGLGGIIDNFVIGKLIEIGVAKIIENNTKKECVLDFNIHKLTKENISDPDIIKIIENGKERDPNLFIEIKNTSPEDRWVGLTVEQFNTMLKGKLAKNDPKKVMIICASLLTKNKNGDLDPLGVYLKSKIDSGLLKKFCSIDELYIKIYNIVTGEELKNKGTNFNEGSYMYETDIIIEAGKLTTKRVLNTENKDTYKKIDFEKTNIPIIMCDLNPKPKEFGEFKYKGDIDIYVKENRKNGKLKEY